MSGAGPPVYLKESLPYELGLLFFWGQSDHHLTSTHLSSRFVVCSLYVNHHLPDKPPSKPAQDVAACLLLPLPMYSKPSSSWILSPKKTVHSKKAVQSLEAKLFLGPLL